MNKIRKVVVAGGGAAGWMAATALSRQLNELLDIVLIESDEIGIVGVGEATIPPLRVFHKLLRIDEKEFMQSTESTFKLGIQFENWGNLGENYIHSFGRTGKETWMAEFQHFWLRAKELGIEKEFGEYCLEWKAAKEGRFGFGSENNVNYAYHLDAQRYAKYLRSLSEKNGVKRIEGIIEQVNQNFDTGFIESLVLKSGEIVEGDLFIDCTGFQGLLIEKTLHTGYEDWSHWLINNRAVAVQTESTTGAAPYTRSIAHESGWCWRIPLQHRMGNGNVYCSQYMSDDEALDKLMSVVDGELLTEPRVIPFRPGKRRQNWVKNVVALGLASGFVEPLESTSIHLIMMGITRLMHLFPFEGIRQSTIDEYNDQAKVELERIRDFIILHYKVTSRDDSPYWRQCRDMNIPQSLSSRIDIFRESAQAFQKDDELFRIDSWIQVMLGQGLTPESYHHFVRIMKNDALKSFMDSLTENIQKSVDKLPFHQDFIKQYCPSDRVR